MEHKWTILYILGLLIAYDYGYLREFFLLTVLVTIIWIIVKWKYIEYYALDVIGRQLFGKPLRRKYWDDVGDKPKVRLKWK